MKQIHVIDEKLSVIFCADGAMRLDELFAWLGWLWLVVRSYVASTPVLNSQGLDESKRADGPKLTCDDGMR
jgi:hypothetical protein